MSRSSAVTSATGQELHRISLCLAGSFLGIESRSGVFIDAAGHRFGPFRKDGLPGFTVRHLARPPRSTESAATAQYTVDIDSTARTAWLDPGEGPGALDGALRLVLPDLIAPKLVMHGALLGDGHRCWLCCGASGAGKSTLARLAGDLALCDELAAVDAAPVRVSACSLPFWRARPGGGSLEGIFLLEHGPEHRRSPLAAGDAIRELARHVCWPTGGGERHRDAFQSLATVVEAVPVARLAFRPDPGVVDLIAGGT